MNSHPAICSKLDAIDQAYGRLAVYNGTMKHFVPPRGIPRFGPDVHRNESRYDASGRRPFDRWLLTRDTDEDKRDPQEDFVWANIDLIPTDDWRTMMLWLGNNTHCRIVAPGGKVVIYTTGRAIVAYDRSTWRAYVISTEQTCSRS